MHYDYPLATEKLEISHNMLWNYCSSTANEFDIKIRGANKLDHNLGHKNKYFLHYRNLQLMLSFGMKLVKVLRILKFKQFAWLKKFIDFNAGKRKKASNNENNENFREKNKS